MKRRILVLGAANFIGSRVIAALESAGWAAPVAFDGSFPREIDGVANCTLGSPSSIRRTAATLFEHAGRQWATPPRIVHLSSMTVYGSPSRDVDESSAPVLDLGDYGAAHAEAEALAKAHTNSVILRCGCEYGPACPQWSERIARLLLAHRFGDLGIAGDGVCNLLYIDDLIAAILKSLEAPAVGGETFNLAMRGPPSWNEYLIRYGMLLRAVPVSRITARRLKLETQWLAPPLKILELAAQRLAPRWSRNITPITPSLVRLCQQQITLDVTKAEKLLAMRWTPLGDGLSRAAAAFVSS